MKVAKFGGSSLANAEQFTRVASIVKNDPSRKFIVVSAPGKQFEQDMKITDLFIQLGANLDNNAHVCKQIETIMQRFLKIIKGLKLPLNIAGDIKQRIHAVIESAQPKFVKREALKSLGEDSSARILSMYLQTLGLDATYLSPKDAGIYVSNEPGRAQLISESYSQLYTWRNKKGIFVIPGFFGYTKDGKLATFSRGGSDITGSIVAAGVKADLYENFTDVDSVYVVNPQIVNNPKTIHLLTYKEMRELSYAGFSVFHDEALIPAFKAKIPVCIKNTNKPDADGTMIVDQKKPSEKCVVGIASDTGFCNIFISKFLMNRELGFGRRLFQILEEESISFEHAPSGIDDMSIIIRESQLTDKKEQLILRRIHEELQPDYVQIQRDLAMVMIVGEGMMKTKGIAQKATTAFTRANVNIEVINQGSSEVSMMFGIQSKDLNQSIRSLYQAFFEN